MTSTSIKNSKQRWHEKHPLLFDWLKRGTWAAIAAVCVGAFAWAPSRELLASQVQVAFWAVVLVAALILALGTALLIAYIEQRRQPGYLGFTRTEHGGVVFRWRYEDGEPSLPSPHCPSCDGQLEAITWNDPMLPETRFECPTCRFSARSGASFDRLLYEVGLRIRQQVRCLGGNPKPLPQNVTVKNAAVLARAEKQSPATDNDLTVTASSQAGIR